MGSLSVGIVVFLPFPFSDLSQSKLRPAVVLADAGKDDWVLCQVTSKAYADEKAIKIEEEDFETGPLKMTSYARPSKLFTANSSLIASQIGKLKPDTLALIIEAIVNLLSSDIETAPETDTEQALDADSDTESE